MPGVSKWKKEVKFEGGRRFNVAFCTYLTGAGSWGHQAGAEADSPRIQVETGQHPSVLNVAANYSSAAI